MEKLHLSKQELRDRAAKAVQLVDRQFDKDVMDVMILVVDEGKQYVQLSVRTNFRDKDEEEQMREAL
jgi:translation initiation factor 2 alpha subunit (eIF-2alpha)